jgi:hypothetical protein
MESLFFILLAVWIFLKIYDFKFSREFILYDFREGNKFFRNKLGFLDFKKALIVQLLLSGMFFGFYWMVPKYAFISLIPGIGIGFYLFFDHIKGRKKRRELQKSILKQIRELPKDQYQIPQNNPNIRIQLYEGKTLVWLNYFRHIYLLSHIYPQNFEHYDYFYKILFDELRRISNLPENKWFPKYSKYENKPLKEITNIE